MADSEYLIRLIIETLRREMEKSTGCTDPGSVCLAVSRAVRELGARPRQALVAVSPNVYKNGVSVGIPGTGKRGLKMAAALGCFIEKSETGLEILNFVTPEIIDQANRFAEDGHVRVTYADSPDPLYVKAEVSTGTESATVIISGDYSNIIHVSRNGRVSLEKPAEQTVEAAEALIAHKLKDLYEAVLAAPAEIFRFLLESAQINRAAAELGLKAPGTAYGKKLLAGTKGYQDGPQKIAHLAGMMTAAASEARMSGLVAPVMAIAGSGNHGITNFLGTFMVADSLGADEEHALRALAISSVLTVYTKEYIKRMTAFCGCSVAAATGVSAATVYLLGGTFAQSVLAVNSLVGTLGGMFCDGAKESCAYKLGTAVMAAVHFAYLATEGCGLPAGVGVVGNTIEDTFYNLGQLNNPGMRETNRVILELIERTEKQKIT